MDTILSQSVIGKQCMTSMYVYIYTYIVIYLYTHFKSVSNDTLKEKQQYFNLVIKAGK